MIDSFIISTNRFAFPKHKIVIGFVDVLFLCIQRVSVVKLSIDYIEVIISFKGIPGGNDSIGRGTKPKTDIHSGGMDLKQRLAILNSYIS